MTHLTSLPLCLWRIRSWDLNPSFGWSLISCQSVTSNVHRLPIHLSLDWSSDSLSFRAFFKIGSILFSCSSVLWQSLALVLEHKLSFVTQRYRWVENDIYELARALVASCGIDERFQVSNDLLQYTLSNLPSRPQKLLRTVWPISTRS